MAIGARGRQDDLPDHEELMLDYAVRLRRHTVGRRAVHIHLSRLSPNYRRSTHIRIAANSFNNLVQDHEGQCFRLINGDLVVIVKDATVAKIDEIVLRLRYLFSDDPLIAEDSHDDPKQFCTWFNLEDDYDEFLSLIRTLHGRYDTVRAARLSGDTGQVGEEDAEGPKEPLYAARLGQLEDVLQTSDVTSLLRRQTVCAMVPGSAPSPVFNEIFISIADLSRRVMPEVDISANRWLFQHLTEVLDKRMLRALPDAERAVSLPSSINMNVSTILSDEFMAFDRQYKIMTSKTMIIELQPIDIFADIGAYIFARDYLHDRGYRICLDGLNHLSMPILRRDELKFDLQKVFWSTELLDEVRGERREALQKAITLSGPARVVLCRCEDHRALAFGQELGITMFQGRYVERALSAASGN